MINAAISDPLLRCALLGLIATGLLATVLTLWVASLRLRLTIRTVHETRFISRWRPLLLEAIDAVPAHLPRVKQPDWFAFLVMWNHFQESLRGPGRHRLKAVALRLRMDYAARSLLATRDMNNRLVAVITLGHLGDQDSWDVLEEIARSRRPLLSLAALRALVLIDPSRGTAVLLSSLGGRSDWPTARLQAIAADAGPSVVSEALVQAADIAVPSELPRLIALMDSADADIVTPFLEKLIRSSRDDEALVACLKSRHVPRDPDLLKRLARHSAWQVRTQAARVLGGVAAPGDEEMLISMLSDPVWWVRYRAAQALAKLAFLSREDLWRLRFLVTDRFAQDILDQVVAEKQAR